MKMGLSNAFGSVIKNKAVHLKLCKPVFHFAFREKMRCACSLLRHTYEQQKCHHPMLYFSKKRGCEAGFFFLQN